MVIGHNPGALGPLVEIGNKLNVPMLFDAEDYHRGEFHIGSQESLRVQKLEDDCIPQITAMTAASPLIAKAYEALYPQHQVTTINNAFPKNNQPVLPTSESGPLKIIWFSQVVGLDRGLAEFLQRHATREKRSHTVECFGIVFGMTCSNICSEVLLRNCIKSRCILQWQNPPFLNSLQSMKLGWLWKYRDSLKSARLARIEQVVLVCYPDGLPHAFISKTPAQEQFLREFPDAGELIDLNEPKTIAEPLGEAFEKRDELLQKRQRAWQLGDTVLNWEKESEVLVHFVGRA